MVRVIRHIRSTALHIRLSNPEHRPKVEQIISTDLGVPVHIKSDPVDLIARVSNPERVSLILSELSRLKIPITSFSFGQPSLDEVFLTLTGHQAETVDKETT